MYNLASEHKNPDSRSHRTEEPMGQRDRDSTRQMMRAVPNLFAGTPVSEADLAKLRSALQGSLYSPNKRTICKALREYAEAKKPGIGPDEIAEMAMTIGIRRAAGHCLPAIMGDIDDHLA